MRRIIMQMMAVLLVVQAVSATDPAGPTTNWAGFQQQVTQYKLNNRTAWISLTTGDAIKVVFLKAINDGLVVQSNRKTKQWNTGNGEAMIPKSLVSRVEFTGKVGRRGLIGGLAGLAAGAGATAAVASGIRSGQMEGAAGGGLLLAVPALAIVGYLAGHALDRPAPSFDIER